jgi:SagB-type dehydrogenase family enzyme
VRRGGGGLDWSRQPSPFKIYADHPLIPLDLERPWHRFIYFLGGIDAKKSYPGVEYYLRTIPSAGALYPIEIYFQARNHPDFKDGIYHFDVANLGVRLLYELREDEGVEAYFADRRMVEGLVILYSGLYYRSSWKYRTRAFRYVLLDAGHALGALEAASFWISHAYHIRYRFDRVALAEHFGFERGELMISSGTVGRYLQKEARGLGMRLAPMDVTRFFTPDPVIEGAYLEGLRLARCRAQPRFPKNPFMPERLAEAILQRRSVRAFAPEPIKKEQFEFVYGYMQGVIPNDCDEAVRIWSVVNNVEGLERGLYLDGELVRAGDFRVQAGYLCLEQALGSESAVTFFLTGRGVNYQPMYQKAGHIGHRCYIGATYLGLGASGIGAYYDDEVRAFLETDDMVLYAIALGKGA